MISTLHVVFKTHLDLGFTDYGRNVTDRYVHEYLPRAISLARELERRGGVARFRWTTGSWLIHEAFRLGSAQEQEELDAAIRAGHVSWHGLPLTTHTELMDAGLLRHAISIGRKLDTRFGRRTIAAKMTDVPGHTVGIVPFLADAGLEYLHLGVNGASAVPEVPEFFIWRAPDGSEAVVNYAQSYGATELGVAMAPGGTHALHLAHTGDNFGPPPIEEVEELFAQLQAKYPGAEIIASTLDAFAGAVLENRSKLPVLEQEIGDSWIHGVASDPLQTSRFRALLRLREQWVGAGELTPGTAECDSFSDGLLLVPEHTWGEDLKTFLPDYVNYAKADFTAARAANAIDPAQNPARFDEFAWAYSENPTAQGLAYAAFEESWAEQRSHLDRAVAALSPVRQDQARQAMAACSPAPVAEGVAIDPTVEHAVGQWSVAFGDDGALTSLIAADGTQWAGPANALAAYRYETFDERDESRWIREYCRNIEDTGFWAIPDQSKPGLAIATTQPATVFTPRVVSAGRLDGAADTVVTLHMALPAEASELWGAPRGIRLSYRFPAGPGPIEIELALTGKDASRLPEAGWLGFRPATGAGTWTLDKLGARINPQNVVRNGNRSLHAVAEVAHTSATARGFSLKPVDATLVAVGRPALYRFDNTIPDPSDGFHVNLHNNMWGTNFTMWFDDDLRSRFVLELS